MIIDKQMDLGSHVLTITVESKTTELHARMTNHRAAIRTACSAALRSVADVMDREAVRAEHP